MPIFKPWDIVRVPFPYTDRPVLRRRPALVIAAGEFQTTHGLLWVLMITAAENRGWTGDVPIVDFAGAGLPIASLVRTAKIATIEAKEADVIGRLPASLRATIKKRLRNHLELK